MFKPNTILSRVLSLLLLPPAAAALSSAQLTKGTDAGVAAHAGPGQVAAAAGNGDQPSRSAGGKNANTLAIVSPKDGQYVRTSTVRVVLEVGRQLRRRSLRVYLNGKDVTSHFSRRRDGDGDEGGMFPRLSSGRDYDDAGRLSATLSASDGLRIGQNKLRANARGNDTHMELRRAEFMNASGLKVGDNQLNWLPPSVGLSLKPGGAQPWVTLTTGIPASVQDNLDPTTYGLPYRDATFPTANDTACSGRYQVVVLNRVTPAVEDAYWCFDDAANLKSKLATLTAGAELVLVGTTENNNADSGLDTTGIGGTNYSVSE